MNDVLVFAIVSGPKSHNVTGDEPVSLFRWKQEGGSLICWVFQKDLVSGSGSNKKASCFEQTEGSTVTKI